MKIEIWFGPVVVEPDESVVLEGSVDGEEPFTLESFTVPASCAPHFLVESLKHGEDEVFLSSHPIPAVMFIETARGIVLGLTSAKTATLSAKNFTKGPQIFVACLRGTY